VASSAPPPPAAAASNGRPALALALVWAASAAVLAGCVLASFRLELAEDPVTLLRVNGPRVLFGAAVGAALALAGGLRLAAGVERPLRELELLALSAGAAGGGFVAAHGRLGAAALAAFAVGSLLGAAASFAAVRALDRPRRWTNLGAAALLAAFAGAAALAGTYGRERRDGLAGAVAWLTGDLATATWASGLAVLALAAILLAASARAVRSGASGRVSTLALLAFGVGTGAAGPLVFVGGMVPRTVRALARGVSGPALLAAGAGAGAATVAAIDAVPRLLVGGYALPFNVAAAMLAVPIFLGWNRARLRREAGPAGRAFETLELALIAGLTLAGAYLAWVLASVIRAVT
jgi:iron complex transport system permease protein